MKPHVTTPILIPALALLLLAAAFVGWQAISAQTAQEELGENPPPAPTGLTATHDGVGVMLEWDDPADDTIVGYRVWRRYHRDSHEDADPRPGGRRASAARERTPAAPRTTSTTATSLSTRRFTATRCRRSARTARRAIGPMR